MTIQEEIREELARRYYYAARPLGNWNDTTLKNKWIARKNADEAITYLHSQGIVIKVERGFPELEHPHYFKEGITSDTDLITFAKAIELEVKAKILKAGCGFFEPLIKEE